MARLELVTRHLFVAALPAELHRHILPTIRERSRFVETETLMHERSEVSSLIIGMLLVGCKLLLGAVSHELHLVDETRETSNISQLPLTVRSDYRLCITK